MSDVTAMVLTIGEPSFQRAMISVREQLKEPAEILVVENEEPVSRAFAVGSQRVKTPFFLQCDADMVLTPDCLQVLRRGMDSGVGVCVGFLQDDIIGPIQGVKLFRKEAVLPYVSRSLASDSDLIVQMIDAGWKVRFCRRDRRYGDLADDILGLHSPAYDDEEYVFNKFCRQGAKARYRQSRQEYQTLLDALKSSSHPRADLALLAFCHGFFSLEVRDLHRTSPPTKGFEIFRRFWECHSDRNTIFSAIKLSGVDYSTYPVK